MILLNKENLVQGIDFTDILLFKLVQYFDVSQENIFRERKHSIHCNHFLCDFGFTIDLTPFIEHTI